MYRLFLESEPRVYESLGRCSHSPVCEIVQPCSTQCLVREMCNDKNFVQNKHVANLQHTISLHRLVHFYDTHRFSILEQIFFVFLHYFELFFCHDMIDWRSEEPGSCWCDHFGVNVSTIRFTGDRASSWPTAVWTSTPDIATPRPGNPSGTFALSSLNYYWNCP